MWRNKVVDSMVSRVYGPTRCDFMCVTEFDRNWREIKKKFSYTFISGTVSFSHLCLLVSLH